MMRWSLQVGWDCDSGLWLFILHRSACERGGVACHDEAVGRATAGDGMDDMGAPLFGNAVMALHQVHGPDQVIKGEAAATVLDDDKLQFPLMMWIRDIPERGGRATNHANRSSDFTV